jgi:hypothetical protein
VACSKKFAQHHAALDPIHHATRCSFHSTPTPIAPRVHVLQVMQPLFSAAAAETGRSMLHCSVPSLFPCRYTLVPHLDLSCGLCPSTMLPLIPLCQNCSHNSAALPPPPRAPPPPAIRLSCTLTRAVASPSTMKPFAPCHQVLSVQLRPSRADARIAASDSADPGTSCNCSNKGLEGGEGAEGARAAAGQE